MKYSSSNRVRVRVIYTIAILGLLFSGLLGILLGATKLQLTDLLSFGINMDWNRPETKIIYYVRLPRVAGSLLCGAALSVSGAVIQGVLGNPLASPSIIGVNAGAGLAVTLCSALGIIGGWRMSLFAFIGAFISIALISLAAQKIRASKGTVILMGVALNSLWGAMSDTITTFIPEVSVLSNDFKVGDFSSVTVPKLVPASMLIFLSILLLCSLSNELDVLILGDESAQSLGMNTSLMRIVFLILAAVLAGSAVSLAGLLSFIGLLVPHAVRRMVTNESKHLIPLCALFGAGFVTICDTASRVIFAPYELPVGIVMAFLGVPFFLYLLFKKKGVNQDV